MPHLPSWLLFFCLFCHPTSTVLQRKETVCIAIFTCLLVHLYAYLSTCVPNVLPVHLCCCLPVCLIICPSTYCPLIYLPFHLSSCPLIYPLTCPLIHLPLYLSNYLHGHHLSPYLIPCSVVDDPPPCWGIQYSHLVHPYITSALLASLSVSQELQMHLQCSLHSCIQPLHSPRLVGTNYPSVLTRHHWQEGNIFMPTYCSCRPYLHRLTPPQVRHSPTTHGDLILQTSNTALNMVPTHLIYNC